jgi:Trypsin-like serine proteases, typically periplasmic, contain C-terminal PDZ domain
VSNEQIQLKRNNLKLRFLTIACFLTGCLLNIPTVLAQSPPRSIDTDALHQLDRSIQELVRKVRPSVVQVMVTGYGPVENNANNTSLVIGRQQSIGSGVIIDPSGWIVTNAHVVQGSQHVQVIIPATNTDEASESSLSARVRTMEARIVGSDSTIDLALLKVEATGLPALQLSDYNKLRQGEVVFAFGSPDGLPNSVTMGVVSAAARQPDADSPKVFVQTDAPVNPGNSGGPLINVDGEVVGINTYILTESGGNEGVGFAIPSAVVALVWPQLKKYGHVHRGETGIAIQAITPSLAAGLNLSTDSGVIVSDVVPGSPADTAGLKVRDIITSIDGKPVENLPWVGTRLFMRSGGEHIKLGVLRGSEKLSFDILVVEVPHDFERLPDSVDPDKNLVSQLGVVVIEIDSKIAALLSGLRMPSGLIVAAKAADSKVNTPLATGDVIHAINGAPVDTIESLRSALDHLKPNASVVLQIERAGKLMFIAFQSE